MAQGPQRAELTLFTAMKEFYKKLINYTHQLVELIDTKLAGREDRTFGFEYEFLPNRPLSAEDLNQIQTLLVSLGYERQPGLFRAADHYITFEPGGQIEYCSIPIAPEDCATPVSILNRADHVNGVISSRLGIAYLPISYIPGRADAPMVLDNERYHDLHRLLAKTGSRGHEMMKGTAAVHLHVALLSLQELPTLWQKICTLSQTPPFAMGSARREIWNHTDPSRCGLLCKKSKGFHRNTSSTPDPKRFLKLVAESGLKALDLATGRPFGALEDQSFAAFLSHLTTIFTDVRLNLKGVTLELRTPDSVPPRQFMDLWSQFIRAMRPPETRKPIHKGQCERGIGSYGL